MNIIVAFLLLFIVGLYQGESVVSTTIDKVESGTPAAAAGIQPGDKIVSVAGSDVSTWEEARAQILTHPGETVAVVVDRNGQPVQLSAELQKQENGTGFLGVQPDVAHQDLGFVGALGYAGQTTGTMVKLIFVGIKMMFTGQVPVTGSQGFAGPVGIIQISSQAFQGGYYLTLLALISINLAIFNMLPVLPLDGGHVLFSIIERIRGKSVSLRVFEQVSMIGLLIFVALFILATSNDIGRIFGQLAGRDGKPATGDAGERRRGRRRPGLHPVDDQHQDGRRRGHAGRRSGPSPPRAQRSCGWRCRTPQRRRRCRPWSGGSPVPLVADIHFDHRLAVAAIRAGVAGIRINPGNIRGKDAVREVVEAADEGGTVIRVGRQQRLAPAGPPGDGRDRTRRALLRSRRSARAYCWRSWASPPSRCRPSHPRLWSRSPPIGRWRSGCPTRCIWA